MRHIKILKVYETERYSGYEEREVTHTYADGLDWHEVDDKQFEELRELIQFANSRKYELKVDYDLQLIEEVHPLSIDSHLKSAKDLFLAHQEKIRKMNEKEEKAKLAREEKRKATELEKKRKQLEKLQKELEGHF